MFEALRALSSLSEHFGLQPLIDKRLGIISDARLSGRADQDVIVERLLSITGEDGIQIDRKNKSHWDGQLKIRFVIISNLMLRLMDASGALASRFIILAMTRSWLGQEDLGLFNRLVQELPGILNWSIEGWKRLKERGYFIQPKSAQELVSQFEDLSSAIRAFVRDRCDVGAGHMVLIDDLFRAWQMWCASEGRSQPGNKASFGRDLKSAFPGIATVRPRDGEEKRPRQYAGGKLTEGGKSEAAAQQASAYLNLNTAAEQRKDQWWMKD